ncbi:hypothetical protein [Larkinella punicea]|uniref:Uncharacterized protein n=1 Tax=Larkinella punicea TaxID=2315727 RepID=A0A368JIN7_9BACT|nr:hypothetical protein [Larkinella punicea]RCR67165.1 hypothetical protein DUE52_22900 [Larkinella punicea]
MTVQQATLENTFQEMGYTSMADYAIQKAREELLQELKKSLDEVAQFETKYSMTYLEFDKRFHDLTQFGLFEREDDIMDWRAELEVIRVVEKRLARLTA